VQERSESLWRDIAHRRGGRDARLTQGGIREHDAFLGHEMRGPPGGKAKAQGRGMGRGAIACHHHHVLFRICLSISAFCLDEKGY